MKELNCIVLVVVLAVAGGCATSQQINGSYHSDPKYLAASYEMMEMDSKVIEHLSANGPKVIINYPEMIMTHYGASFGVDNDVTTVTKNCQTNDLRKINDQLYLQVKKTTHNELYFPTYFDNENECVYMMGNKFIKDR